MPGHQGGCASNADQPMTYASPNCLSDPIWGIATAHSPYALQGTGVLATDLHYVAAQRWGRWRWWVQTSLQTGLRTRRPRDAHVSSTAGSSPTVQRALTRLPLGSLRARVPGTWIGPSMVRRRAAGHGSPMTGHRAGSGTAIREWGRVGLGHFAYGVVPWLSRRTPRSRRCASGRCSGLSEESGARARTTGERRRRCQSSSWRLCQVVQPRTLRGLESRRRQENSTAMIRRRSPRRKHCLGC